MSKTDVAVYAFESSSAAWSFMRACDRDGLSAGFPSLDGKNTVRVSIPTWMARETADRAAGKSPAEYHFAA